MLNPAKSSLNRWRCTPCTQKRFSKDFAGFCAFSTSEPPGEGAINVPNPAKLAGRRQWAIHSGMLIVGDRRFINSPRGKDGINVLNHVKALLNRWRCTPCTQKRFSKDFAGFCAFSTSEKYLFEVVFFCSVYKRLPIHPHRPGGLGHISPGFL